MIPVTHAQAVERARSVAYGKLLPVPPGAKPDAVPSAIKYLLGHGGKHPSFPHPGEPAFGPRVWAADCSAFAAWCLGLHASNEPGFPHFSGDIATQSVWEAATKRTGWFEFVDRPEPGDLAVYPNTYLLGVRVKVGHVGLVVQPQQGAEFGWFASRVIHCSSSASKKLGHAIAETDARIWQKRGRFVRFLKAA